MLQETITRSAGRKKLVRATYYHSRSAVSNGLRQYLHYYRIEAPSSTSFLPSDEMLEALVSTVPGVKFLRCNRWNDRDVLCVYAANKNIFTTRATATARKIRKEFLEDVAAFSSSEPRIPIYLMELCHRFFLDAEMVYVEWDGTQAIAYNSSRNCFRGHLMTSDMNLGVLFRTFERSCAGHYPFTFGAPPDR